MPLPTARGRRTMALGSSGSVPAESVFLASDLASFVISSVWGVMAEAFAVFCRNSL
jgi:hypothetical protein